MSGAFMVCAQTLAWSEKTAIAETTQKFRRQWRPALRERRSMYESCMNRIGLVHPLVGQPVANIKWGFVAWWKDPACFKLCRVSTLQYSATDFENAIRAVKLKLVTQAELKLAFGGIGCALAGDFTKRAAGWVHIGIVPVGVVGVIESLCPEGQLMVLIPGYEMEAFFHCRIKALESWAVDDVAGFATGKSADGSRLKDASLKPRTVAAELVRQVRRARVHVELVARTGSDSRLIKIARNISRRRTAG